MKRVAICVGTCITNEPDLSMFFSQSLCADLNFQRPVTEKNKHSMCFSNCPAFLLIMYDCEQESTVMLACL